MVDPIELWHAEHANFSRLLDVLGEQLAAFHDGGTPVYGLMLDIVSYLRDYADRVHHPREDAAFACLVIRDPTLRLPINRLLQEHRAICVAGEELVTRLNEIVLGSVMTRASVEATAALYLNYYRHHLATEERQILPRAASLLTSQDWSRVVSAVPAVPDPLFGTAPDETYRELREWLAARAAAA